jgi:hypothetical protein
MRNRTKLSIDKSSSLIKNIFMKRIYLLIIICCVCKINFAQITINQGTHVTSIGSTTQIVLENTSVVNNGTINHTSGTIKFIGNSASSISGSGTLNMYKLELAKSSGISLTLSKNIGVRNQLNFVSGRINLNGFEIDLFSTGTLVNESESHRIVGNNGGKVKTTVNLNAPNAANPGNLGAILTSTENMGSVVIQRGHQSQLNDQGTGSSILRYFDINPANNFNLKATLRFKYFDAEVNGINEADLVLFKGAANGSWDERGYTTKDATLNYVEKINIPDFSRWTLSNTGNALASGCPGDLPEETYYRDADGDGYGDAENTITACSQPAGYVTNKTDCNDNNSNIHPGATEICNGIDDDCDGQIDEGVKTIYYPDADGDGYGSIALSVTQCSPPANYTSIGGDCNDNNSAINPGATEICGNGIDDNCNDQTDEGCPTTSLSITINDITVSESQGTAQLTVSLSSPSATAVRVSYRTLNGTASHPKDYARSTGEVVFAPGSTTQIINISIVADNKSEPNEYFDVQLHTPTGATIGDNNGRVTITESLLTRVLTNKVGSADNSLDVKVSSNPTNTQFRLQVISTKENLITIQVSDVQGKIIERLQAKHPFQPIHLGANYKAGVYFAQVIQGNERKTVKLIKF